MTPDQVPATPDPYCSTCKQPAVWRESVGVVHLQPDGRPIYPNADTSGHTPDLSAWNAEYDRIIALRRDAHYGPRDIGRP